MPIGPAPRLPVAGFWSVSGSIVRRVVARSRAPGANWIANVTFPPPTSTVPCITSGVFGTPADATASPTGSATSAWKELGDDGAVVELGPLLPHAAARKTIAASPASL